MGPRPRVVITSWVHPEVVDELAERAEVIANTSREPWTRDGILERSHDADALMAFMSDRVDEAFLVACPRLRIVACALKGYDNFDVGACTRRGVWLTIVPDLLTAPTAELTVALLLALARNVVAGDRLIRAMGFEGWRPQLYGRGLASSTVGIIGMGAVGRATAERMLGFGPTLLYHDVRPLPSAEEARLQARHVALDVLLGASSFVILALPLNARTQHLIDAVALGRMPRGSYLVNSARGSLVDETAVAEALATGHLAGYAADVFELED